MREILIVNGPTGYLPSVYLKPDNTPISRENLGSYMEGLVDDEQAMTGRTSEEDRIVKMTHDEYELALIAVERAREKGEIK